MALASTYYVTGDPAPDATGPYVENGTFDGKAAFERTDGAYWLWWYSPLTA